MVDGGGSLLAMLFLDFTCVIYSPAVFKICIIVP